jgi:hypothetical protein
MNLPDETPNALVGVSGVPRFSSSDIWPALAISATLQLFAGVPQRDD